MAEKTNTKPSVKEQIKEITERMESGIQDLFTSDKYTDYLKTMSKFYNYSTRNTLLIHMQMPGASKVAGFNAWRDKFERHVKKGEKGIKILAPAPFKTKQEMEKLDPDTQAPMLDETGKPVVEEVEITIPQYKIVPVFDVSQTDGKPLPQLAEDLTGDVRQYEAFMDALKQVSPLPVVFEPLSPDMDGFCRYGEKIVIREGMSEIQTVSAAIHEIAHGTLHDLEQAREAATQEGAEPPKPKDRRTKEVEAESVSYAVCQYYGIETSANSFGYLATWSKDRELSELKASLDTIRKTAAGLIASIDERFAELAKERGIDLTPQEPEQPARFVVVPEDNAFFIRDTATNTLHGEDTSHGTGLVARYTDEAAAQEEADRLNRDVLQPPAPEAEVKPEPERPAPAKPERAASAPAKGGKRKYYITDRQREQSERMAEKWEARAEAFYAGGDGWGADTAGYCKSLEEAEQAEERAQKIHDAINSLSSGSGTWADVQTIRTAVSERDALDAQVETNQDISVHYANIRNDANEIVDSGYIAHDNVTGREVMDDTANGAERRLREQLAAETEQPATPVDLKTAAETLQKLNDRIQDTGPNATMRTEAFNAAKMRLEVLRDRIPDSNPQLTALLNHAIESPDFPTLKERMETLKTEFIQHYADAPETERNPDPVKEADSPAGSTGGMKNLFGEPAAEPEPEQAAPIEPEPESNASKLTELQKKGIEIAKRYEHLPMQKRINIIAETFGCKTATIRTSPCTGKWRGTSDISLDLDNGSSLFIGNYLTPRAKTAKIQNECVNSTLAAYNPELVAETKTRIVPALLKREAEDNAIAAEKGLKPYTFLNVELCDGSDKESGGHLGWYYITVAVDGKIFGLVETGLYSDISRGELRESRPNYFVAGALKENDVDFVFNNVGHASTIGLYKLPLTDKARERDEKTLNERLAAGITERQEPAAPAPPTKEQGATLEEKLYTKFAEMFPQFISGEYRHMRLEAGEGFMPLSLEWLNSSQISVMHTFKQNGDTCYDPMIVFEAGYGEKDVKTLTAVEFEQSMPPIYQVKDSDGRWSSIDGNGNEKTVFGLQKSINEFSAQWFKNIGQQGYMPVRAEISIDGKDTQITFDADGKPVMPEPEKPEKKYDLGYGFMGNGLTVWNRLEEKHGDYVTVAHIGPDRSVTFYDKDMPDSVKAKIEHEARTSNLTVSATQDAPVFSTPAKQPERKKPEPTPYQKAHDVIAEIERTATKFGAEERNLIVNYAYQTQDVYRTIKLAHELAEARFELQRGYIDPKMVNRVNADISAAHKENPQLRDEDDDIVFPDPEIGPSERDLYGYSYEKMMPLTQDRALELYDQDNTVYLLYPDNTEGMAFDRDDIQNHDGIFGIEREEWEATQEFQAMTQAAENSEASKESMLVYGKDNTFGIYQLKGGDDLHYHRFASLDQLDKEGLAVERGNYELIYTAPFKDGDTLDSIYDKFNMSHPFDYRGHSLSVSDIVVLQQHGEITSHYVDNFGFKELPVFLVHEKQPELAPPPAPETAAPEQTGPTVAELEAQVKAGGQINLTDLARAVKAERRPPDKKGKPSILAQLQEDKKALAGNGDTRDKSQKRDSDREV